MKILIAVLLFPLSLFAGVSVEVELSDSGVGVNTNPTPQIVYTPSPVERVAQLAAAQMIAASNITVEEIRGIVDVFPAWRVGVLYVAGTFLRYSNQLYQVIQTHTSQADWTPDVVPALFMSKTDPSVIAAWAQPTGAQDAYQLGDKVTHNGQTWTSIAANNVWEPGVYGWTTD